MVEAVERLPFDAPAGAAGDPAYRLLVDELGDLLYQVIFHAVLAEEAGAFTMADVARGIHDKLVRRHPHVFGDVDAGTSADVMRNWEQIKKEEKGADSIVAGITPGSPVAPLRPQAPPQGRVGRPRPRRRRRVARAPAHAPPTPCPPRTRTRSRSSLGDLLAATVALARAGGVDTESALRGWSARFRERFERIEHLAARPRPRPRRAPTRSRRRAVARSRGAVTGMTDAAAR